jgi:biotin transport system substrate-specific component
MKTDSVRAEVIRSSAVRRAGLVLAGIGILTASAWLSVPFYPVPLTMQTLAVLLIGGMLGPTLGVSTVAGYLALGALGAPVFHNGLGGPAVIAGPTGGYLVGFLAAAFLMGWAARIATIRRSAPSDMETGVHYAGRGRRAGSGSAWWQLSVLAVGAIAGSAAIYAFGVPWLALAAGLEGQQAVAAGLTPFLLGDLLKSAVAVGAIYLGGRAVSRRRSPLI